MGSIKNINGDEFSKWWKSKVSFKNIFGGGGGNKNSAPAPAPNMSSLLYINDGNYSAAEKSYVIRNFDREINNAYGANADKLATVTNPTLINMKNILPTLKAIYPKTGYAALDAEPNIFTVGRAEAKTWAYSTDNYKKSNIVFYRAAFSSIRRLAHDMIHEFGHAVNFFNMNYGTYRGSHSAEESDKWGEREAFKFAFDHGGLPYKNDQWYLLNK